MNFRSKKPKPTPILSQWSASRDIIPYGHFDQATLKTAVELIQGTNPDYRFDEDGALQVISPQRRNPIMEERFAGLMPISNNFSPDRLEAIQSAVAILANIALKQDRSFDLGEALQITAHPKEPEQKGALLQGMFDDLEAESSDVWGDDNFMGVNAGVPPDLLKWWKENGPRPDERIKALEGDLASLRKGEGVRLGDYNDEYSGAPLLGEIMQDIRSLREDKADAEIWRLHNIYPEAVNFYFAAQEAEFLLDPHAAGRQIKDIKPFINSYWPQLAGKIDLKVDPFLLKEARQFLAVHPVREPETVLR